MVHHIFKHAAKHVGKYYAANPHKVGVHGLAAVQIGGIVWMHAHRVAKHTGNFMVNAAVKGFNLFRS